MDCDSVLSHLSSAVTQLNVTGAISLPELIKSNPSPQQIWGSVIMWCASTIQTECYVDLWQHIVRYTADSQLGLNRPIKAFPMKLFIPRQRSCLRLFTLSSPHIHSIIWCEGMHGLNCEWQLSPLFISA